MLTNPNIGAQVVVSVAAKAYHDISEINSSLFKSPVELTAFVSCYNEQEFIIKTLTDICSALKRAVSSYEIVVIDDCSSDDSFVLLKSYVENNPAEKIVLIRNSKNKGLAQNFVDGAFIGKGKYYKLFCGDNTETPEAIITICSLIGQYDIIIPNYNEIKGKSFFRVWLSKIYTSLVNIISGNNLKYYNGLHLHLRHNIMRWHPNTRGFGFQADIICMLLDQGATYMEVGVPNVHRDESSALNWRNVLSVIHTLVDILIRRIANIIYVR